MFCGSKIDLSIYIYIYRMIRVAPKGAQESAATSPQSLHLEQTPWDAPVDVVELCYCCRLYFMRTPPQQSLASNIRTCEHYIGNNVTSSHLVETEVSAVFQNLWLQNFHCEVLLLSDRICQCVSCLALKFEISKIFVCLHVCVCVCVCVYLLCNCLDQVVNESKALCWLP